MAIYQLKRNSLADQIVNEDKLANASVLPQHIDSSVDSDVIGEGSTNLYFTNTRAISALTPGVNMIIDANGLITANVVGGGGASVTVANTAPVGASEGDLYFDEDLGKLFVYFNDGDTNQWVEASPLPDYSISNTTIISALTAGTNMIIDANGLITANVSGGSASVSVSNTAPESATEGDLYWDEDLGRLFIYYTDADTSQWVEASPVTNFSNTDFISAFTAGTNMSIAANGLVTARLVAGSNMIVESNGYILANVVGGGGASVTIANAAPAGATEGDLYWDEDLGKLFIYYVDDDSNQWVEVTSKVANVSVTTTQVTEGDNLYFTNTRAISAFTANENMEIASNGLITANVTVTADTGAVPLPHPFLLAGM